MNSSAAIKSSASDDRSSTSDDRSSMLLSKRRGKKDVAMSRAKAIRRDLKVTATKPANH
jgi:hypothetical protein